MKQRAKEFKEILEFAKSKGYSRESAEEIFKLWNYVILPNEAVDFIGNNPFLKFIEEWKEADEIFTELQFNEREKIKLFHIITGEDGEKLYYKTPRPLILPNHLITRIKETKNEIEANKNKTKQREKENFFTRFFL